MQTFLPYADFGASARVLDDRRLGKQRVETLQILRALTYPTYGWKHHPAVRMWRGHEEGLAAYGLAIVDEWVARGRADTCAATIVADLGLAGLPTSPRTQTQLAAAGELPRWLGDEAFHLSHRASLLRKDPAFYGPVFGDVDPDLPYVWPA
ncbi:MAG: hypothetical protein JWM93_1421 [Frankiales bacterium]|nr:hypothetical protein [Frankiales bacterium]